MSAIDRSARFNQEPDRRWPSPRLITSIVLWSLALVLSVLLWPMGLIAAGLLVAVTAVVAKALPRVLRIVLFGVGALVFVVALLGYLDFAMGHSAAAGSLAVRPNL